MLQNYILVLLFLAVTGILILVVKFVTKTNQMQIPQSEQATSHEFEMDPLIDPSIDRPIDPLIVDSDEVAHGDDFALYYTIAALAIILLGQMIFLVPWAVKAKMLGVFGVIEMVVFQSVVIVGYAWLWKKGAIEWE